MSARLRTLASEKAQLELIVHMMVRLSTASGLENVIHVALKSITEVIGATNTIFYYKQEDRIFYADVFGKQQKLTAIDDGMVRSVFETALPDFAATSYGNTRMTYATEDYRAFTLAYPLIIDNDVIGVVKVENTAFRMDRNPDLLKIFFNFMARHVGGEIHSFRRIKQAYDQLEHVNKELETRVLKRTRDLEITNKALLESEQKAHLLLNASLDAAFLNEAKADISKKMLAQQYDIEIVSAVTLDYARKLTKSRHGFVSSIDAWTLENVAHTFSDMFGGQCRVKDERIAFPIGPDGLYSGLLGHALNVKKAFYTNRPENHPSSKGLPRGHAPINSYMAVPVLIGDKLKGLIALANAARDYSDKDIEGVEKLAEIYALALHRYQYELDRSRMEKQLQQFQRLEAIGTLAGGIAHDFNNILFPIVGMSEMLMEDLPPNSVEYESAVEIFTAARRGSDLVKQILAFSRQSEHKIIPLRIQKILREVLKLSRATIPSDIEITRDIQSDCGMVMADPTQIHQIAMNLMTNAYHAVEGSGGRISVTLAEKSLNADALDPATLAAGRYAGLTISDTGHGIEPAILDKIFEPYFTTKEQGKGTGLGLSVVYGIVKAHGGDITVSSGVGKGTTFCIYIPLAEKYSETISMNSPESEKTGTERILFVDDEDAVIRLEKQMLERLGYHVTTCLSSLEALAIFKADPAGVDLVVTDMSMPNMTGTQLAKALLSIRADIPIIICTGFSERINAEKAEAMGIKGFLMKPIVRSEMAEMIRKLLDEAMQ